MPIQVLNDYAIKRYEEFAFHMDQVRQALDEAAAVVGKIDEVYDDERPEGWQIPTPEDLDKGLKHARERLDILWANAKKYEKELMAKGWMV